MMNEKWTWPSRKWLSARVTALAGLGFLWIESGSWDKPESIMALTIGSAAALAYLTPNKEEE